MSNSARIDELRIKFEENSRRYFAPLANEYRKAGQLEQAIALCREHLPHQPGHMSGYIVYGQALYEAGELAEAESVFVQALELDPENLIALRHLGDIALTNDDQASARLWYQRVLEADPRNDDIAAQLASLVATRMPTPRRTAALPASGFDARLTPPVGMPFVGMGTMPTPDAAMHAVDADAAMRPVEQTRNADDERSQPSNEAISESPASTTTGADAPAEGQSRYSVSMTPLDLDAIDGTDPKSPSLTPWVSDAVMPLQSVSDTDDGEDAIDANHEQGSEIIAPADMHADSDIDAHPENADDQAPRDVVAVSPYDEADAFDYPVEINVQGSGEQTDERVWEDDANSLDHAEPEPFEEGLAAPVWPDTSDLVARVVQPRNMTPSSVAPVDEDVLEDAVAAFGREATDPDFTSATTMNTDDIVDDVVDDYVDDTVDDTVVADDRVAVDVVAEGGVLNDVVADTNGQAADIDSEASFAGLLGDATETHEGAPVMEREDPSADLNTRHDDVADVADSEDPDIAAILAEDSTHDQAGPAPEPVGETSSGFVTETMAELLVSQGFVARAVDVYDELVRRRPFDPVLASRRDELAAMVAGARLFDGAQVDDTPVDDAPVDATEMSAEEPDAWKPASTNAARNEGDAVPGWLAGIAPTPSYGTPAFSTPYALPVVSDVRSARPTARDVFAALAMRRVPRRTPPQQAIAVPEPVDGLASLFGSHSSTDDDIAARALADAFAPVSDADLESGSTLDFAFEQSTPPYSQLVTPPDSQQAVTDVPPAAPVSFPSHATPRNSDAEFSFDRFFPDPATREPEAASGSDRSDAPVTDDLAQFSAWLKGLGNT